VTATYTYSIDASSASERFISTRDPSLLSQEPENKSRSSDQRRRSATERPTAGGVLATLQVADASQFSFQDAKRWLAVKEQNNLAQPTSLSRSKSSTDQNNDINSVKRPRFPHFNFYSSFGGVKGMRETMADAALQLRTRIRTRNSSDFSIAMDVGAQRSSQQQPTSSRTSSNRARD
jgi:hypothetical protein